MKLEDPTEWTPHKSNQRLIAHSPSACAGDPCPVHNVSDHHMRDWPQHYRNDRGITERICPHGIGHPDPDDRCCRTPYGGVHGCDGCCTPPEEKRKSEELKGYVRDENTQ